MPPICDTRGWLDLIKSCHAVCRRKWCTPYGRHGTPPALCAPPVGKPLETASSTWRTESHTARKVCRHHAFITAARKAAQTSGRRKKLSHASRSEKELLIRVSVQPLNFNSSFFWLALSPQTTSVWSFCVPCVTSKRSKSRTKCVKQINRDYVLHDSLFLDSRLPSSTLPISVSLRLHRAVQH